MSVFALFLALVPATTLLATTVDGVRQVVEPTDIVKTIEVLLLCLC
jgi:hypothetical protein